MTKNRSSITLAITPWAERLTAWAGSRRRFLLALMARVEKVRAFAARHGSRSNSILLNNGVPIAITSLVSRTGSHRILILAVTSAAMVAGGSGAVQSGDRSGPGIVPGAQALLFIQRIPSAREAAERQSGAKYEPQFGCYLGGYIEFDKTIKRKILDFDRVQRRDPSQFEERVGKPHAMYFFYVGYGRKLPLGWIRWLAARDKFVHIALEPNDGLDKVRDDAYLRSLADDLAATKARVFLRFGSEMNGEWTNYHKPKQFREKFRLVHSVMHKRAPNVALVWCPYATPIRNIPDYYPGDDATDWVGVNMYSVIYHNNKLSMPCDTEHPNDLLATVYKRYAARKPMMICEFAATHYSECDKRWRPDFAALKIGTLYHALPRLYPRVKAINYFDLSTDGVNNNYSVTDDPSVLEAYKRSTAPAYFLSGGQGLKPGSANVPMRVRDGEALRGNVELSCFARAPSDRVSVRYSIDGKVIYRANHPLDWPCTWDAGSVAPGKHVLALEALDEQGRKVASQSVSVTTSR